MPTVTVRMEEETGISFLPHAFMHGLFVYSPQTCKAAKGGKHMETLIKPRNNVHKLTIMALLTAIAIVIVIPFNPSIFAAAPWMEYDMADVPVLLATFALGPIAGLEVLAAVSLLQAFLLGGNGLVGAVMHFLASGTFILVAYFIYNKGRSIKSMLLGLLLGTLAMAAMMVPLNLIITVNFYGQPIETVKAMLIPIIIPFNLIIPAYIEKSIK